MARRGAPALYELLRKSHLAGGGGSAPSNTPPSTPPSGASERGSGAPPVRRGLKSAGAPGQPITFQVSLLWAVVLTAAAVVLIVIAFSIGTRSGGASPAPEAKFAVVPPTPPKPTPAAVPTPPPLAAPDNIGDPRTKGFKYYVLAHPSTQRAPAMVEFCRANGLDAYLVPDDNAMLTKIVVLPGYRDSSEKSSDPIRKLEAEIKRVGDKWKNAARGNKDFSDAYPEMYR